MSTEITIVKVGRMTVSVKIIEVLNTEGPIL